MTVAWCQALGPHFRTRFTFLIRATVCFAPGAPKESNMFKRLALATLLVGISYSASPALNARAQQTDSQGTQMSQQGIDQDIQLMREDIRSKKKQLIAANLKLTDDESTKFWPVYDRYTADLVKINDDKYAIIKQFVDTWGTITDADALNLAKRALDVEQKVAALRIRYLPEFSKVLPGKKVATFYQIERRIQAMIDLQLGSRLPLVQSQSGQ